MEGIVVRVVATGCREFEGLGRVKELGVLGVFGHIEELGLGWELGAVLVEC